MFLNSHLKLRHLPAQASTAALAVAVICLMVLVAGSASAQTIDLTLNLNYLDPSDATSGGTWEVLARTSEASGIALLSFGLTGVDASAANEGPFGTINGSFTANAGFSNFNAFDTEDGVLITTSQVDADPTGPGETGIFYGVGAVSNGSPRFTGQPMGANLRGPTYSTLTNVSNNPFAPGDGSDASFASGTFSPGSDEAPGFLSSGDFESLLGAVYTSIGTSTTVGTFEEVSGASLSTSIESNLLEIFPDYNGNGTVDAADYTLWRDTLGMVVTPGAGADSSNNGIIDQRDYEIWRDNFGMTMPGAGSGAVVGVPEPSALAVVGVFLGSLLSHRIRPF